MIAIDYVCGFANRLFQYSVARIVAYQKGLELPPHPIKGFPSTYVSIAGSRLDGHPITLSSCEDIVDILNLCPVSQPLLIRGLFQKSYLLTSSSNDIRSHRLKFDHHISPTVELGKSDLVVHIRRGDYLLHNWGAPFSYYQEAINSTTYSNIYIITDDMHDPFLRRFQCFKPTIVCSHYLSDFACLIKAKKIIMSPSTFSWWGAFLSDAEEIFFPIPQHGIWSDDYSKEVDLVLPSWFSQYRYLRCREPLRLNAKERLYFEKKYMKLKIKNQGIIGYFKGHCKSALKLGLEYLR